MSDTLIDLLPAEAAARCRAPLAEAWTLPPALYTDPRAFAAECEAIFARDWLCVARHDQVAAPGDYVCVDLPEQPIVVVRGQDGVLRALSRVCLHRAMPLAEGSGRAKRFTCPYHKWSYGLDGQLLGAPMMEGAAGFEARTCHLPALRVETWLGFVFVNLDASAAPLAPRLARLERLLANYRFDSLVTAATVDFDCPWNWKVLVENFMEAYHHIGPHLGSLEPTFPARAASVEDNGGAPWALLRMPARSAVASAEEGEGAEETKGSKVLPGLVGDERSQLLAMCVFPTMLFAAAPDSGVWYDLRVAAHDRMHLRIHVLVPPERRDALGEDGCAALAETVRGVHLEDEAVNRGPWQGLQGRLTGQGRLSPHEAAIWQLNQLWLDRVGGAQQHG